MANSQHPLTGVKLNVISVKNKRLEEAEAVTACLMHLEGVPFTEIAWKLGTNANRVGEVFRGERFPDAKAQAFRLYASHYGGADPA